MIDFSPYISATARKLFGDENKELSTDAELRFGTHGSISIIIKGEKQGSWYDHENKVGGGVLDLLHHKRGLSNGEAVEWLQREVGAPKEEMQTYDYTDEAGKLLFQVVRKIPKNFKQRRPDGAGGWVWKMTGVRRVPYRLPSLISAIEKGITIYVPEGEKDCNNLAAIGLAATCNPGGAGKWRADFAQYFRGAEVVVLPDNDDAGRNHAEQVAANLQPVANTVRILELPKLPLKGDVSDWIARGDTAAELEALTIEARVYSPPALARETEKSAPQPRVPPYSEEGLALRFAERHCNDLRYVALWGHWLEWDGRRWRPEHTLRACDLARAICREAAAECGNAGSRIGIASAKTVAAVERLAKADRRLAASADQWDADPWLLNTPGGTVELCTGRIRAHRREDHCTKVTAVAPGGDCPQWLTFLRRITGDDDEMIGFMRRMTGYFLSGSVSEHALFFGHGTGANGKSVFVSTIAGAMGDYAMTAPMETFVASNSDRHPTELAGLRGARLVTATETEEGRRWNEPRIKTLTGGDKISARFMRQNFFEFVPQFKLFIAGNHRPSLRSVDEAIRRRMNLLPFGVTIPEEERDGKLAEKLRDEWSGILQWMIDGCGEWQGEGLAQPEAVRNATATYLEAEDALAQWMKERCTVKSGFYTSAADLFANWKAWADTAGEFVGSQKRFSQALLDRGYTQRRQPGSGRMGFEGIGLRPRYADAGNAGECEG